MSTTSWLPARDTSTGELGWIAAPVDCDGMPVTSPAPVFVSLQSGAQVTVPVTSDHEFLLGAVPPGSALSVAADVDSKTLNFLAGDSLSLVSSAGLRKTVTKVGQVVTVTDVLRTSGTWGAGALGFPSNTTTGAPVYVDAAGNIRTVPEHTSASPNGATNYGTVHDVATGTSTGALASTTVVFNNPSVNRLMQGLLTMFYLFYTQLQTGGLTGEYAYLVGNLTINGVLSAQDAATVLHRITYALTHDIVRTYAYAIVPSASHTYNVSAFVYTPAGVNTIRHLNTLSGFKALYATQ